MNAGFESNSWLLFYSVPPVSMTPYNSGITLIPGGTQTFNIYRLSICIPSTASAIEIDCQLRSPQ